MTSTRGELPSAMEIRNAFAAVIECLFALANEIDVIRWGSKAQENAYRGATGYVQCILDKHKTALEAGATIVKGDG